MPSYDGLRYEPPAPVAEVQLRGYVGNASVSVVALHIDTGADITLLPRYAVKSIGIEPLADETYELTGFDGTRSSAQVVELDLIFLNKVFRGKYLLIDAEVGVLGRDILNSLVLLFDGPRQQWSENLK